MDDGKTNAAESFTNI